MMTIIIFDARRKKRKKSFKLIKDARRRRRSRAIHVSLTASIHPPAQL
jgi:hypothetical protein